MKKLIRWMSAFVAVSLFLCISAAAAASPKFYVKADSSSVDVGETFSVFVELSGNNGIDGLDGGLSFDSDILTCISVKAGQVLKDNDALFSSNPKKALFAGVSPYPILGDGVFLEVTFRADKAGSTTIALKNANMISGGKTLGISSSAVTVKVEGSSEILPPASSSPVEPVTPEVSPAVEFSDVPTTHWAYTYVQNAVKNGLFSGIGNGLFGPAMNVTRGMFVTTLYSSAGSPDVELSGFADVPANAWYAKAVAWASQQGIVSGIGNNKFGPDMPITREQIALILFNYADGVSPGTEMFVRMSYPDAKDIHDWALTAFTWAMNKDLISGKSGNILDPLATATRAEVAVIMQNFVNISK